MLIRNRLRSSVLSLSLCALACFAMIFVSSFLFLTRRENQIKREAPLTLQEKQVWGQIPGNLSYTYYKNLTLFSLNSTNSGSAQLNLTT